ncbi:putative hydrolase of the HAD superfamily [Chitinophaga costaii]|uniref:Putative hydrolase of the HAD superfamily n=1 Tax=Chitinophaga costaii TaxID=1335309 RepID=A0A1C4FJV5_9BACT|nr:HAD family hydrolase [Chitinophaga costaii]PUZ20320.1 HAD family hydrolase [Chitinophaga costaii]SCC55905.1 putative hydrolase of the HAD superfamily [Chitinophaga costaii]
MNIKVIAFDADDTLWVNEPYFRETEEKFCQLMEDYMPRNSMDKELFKTEIQNLSLYGYGIKGFTLSMIETALRVSEKTVNIDVIEQAIAFGKDLLSRPIELIDGIEAVLHALKDRYRLVVATKGDLLDQERKLRKSGLLPYFHHIEVMSDKQEADYQKLLRHLDVQSESFLMVGNSLKSDILPVLALGGHAIHIPFHTTWAHEQIEHHVEHPNFKQETIISDILQHLL